MAKQTPAEKNKPLSPKEQADEILLILDKEKLLVGAVAKTDIEGKLKTVPPTPDHNNDFLRLNGSDDWLESFATNFFAQAKDPTRFSLIKLKDGKLEDPLVKKALADIEQGKITPEVVKFLKKYEVNRRQAESHASSLANGRGAKEETSGNPDSIKSIDNLKQEKMAKQENTNAPANVDEMQPPRYRFNEAMIDWNQVNAFGISREQLEQRGLYDQLMRGYKSNDLVPITASIGGTDQRYQARISFRQKDDGRVILQTHPLKQAPDLHKPFMGHNFSEDDKVNLTQSGNMGRVVPLKTRDEGFKDSFISVDKKTNQIVAVRVDKAFIADEYSGVKLSDHEKADLREGKAVYIEGMTSKAGKEFNATLQYNADRRGVEYIFPNNLKLEYGQELGTVKLSNKQVDDFNTGKAIFVEDMVRKSDGELFSSFIKRDDMSGKMAYSRVNPDNPQEVYIPKEINGVKVTPDEREQLREGKPIYLNNMTSQRGEDFSSYVKLDLNTGYPMYSKTEDGFEQRREFKLPQEVFGVTLSVKQRADLQDGKAVLIEGMKGFGGQEFSQWAKVNQAGNKLNYFNENPDIKKDATSRNVTQAAAIKKDKSEDKKKGRSHSV